MIDPAKATKGRRMSKKTRKKSSKPAARKTAARSVKSAKTPRSQTRRTVAGKPGRNATRKTANATAKESHKAASKPLITRRAAAAGVSAKSAGGETSAAGRKPVLAEGAKAPGFRLPRDGGSTVTLSDYAGKKLVLFFYPRADTPGCTKEAIDFSRLAGAFAESGTAVLGVSADPPKAQESFRDKHQLSTPLLSDEAHAMLEAYGVWGEKSMYGKTFLGILRTTFLIGEDGRIVRVWRSVKVDGHADAVLAAVKAV
jgi:thioredoxin-dependent peroxiredoxin